MNRRALLAAVSLALCAVGARSAAAHGWCGADEKGNCALVATLAAQAGFTKHTVGEDGPTLGAELDGMHVNWPLWYGFYADVLRDFGSDGTRWGIGPRLGYVLFQLDAGLLQEYRDGALMTGGSARLSISLLVFSAGVRIGHLAGAEDDTFVEVAITIGGPIYKHHHRPDSGLWRPPSAAPK